MTRTQRKHRIKGGNQENLSKIRSIKDETNADVTAKIIENIMNTKLTIPDRRIGDKQLTFETTDNNTYTINFIKVDDNEGQFNFGVGNVIGHPDWFARIHMVSSDDNTVIQAGRLLHDLSPFYFVKYHGIYKIEKPEIGKPKPIFINPFAEKEPVENYSLELMDKIDFTLFKYVIHYIKNKLKPNEILDETQVNEMLNELCPMVYSLWFQKIILEEMKYAKYNERYIDFKADNIGLVFKPDESKLTCVYFNNGLDVALPIKFTLLGQPTTVRMVLFDQQIQTNEKYILYGEHAYIFIAMREIWSPHNPNKKNEINKNLMFANIINTNTRDETDKEIRRKYVTGSMCLNENAYEYLIQNLFETEKYKPFYELCVNIDIVNNLLLKEDIKQLKNIMEAWGIKLLYTNIITLDELKDETNTKYFTKSFYDNIKDDNIIENIKLYISSGLYKINLEKKKAFDINVYQIIDTKIINLLSISTNTKIKTFYEKYRYQYRVLPDKFNNIIQILYNEDKTNQEIFKLVAYLKDDDFESFKALIGTIQQGINEYFSKLNIQNANWNESISYKWFIPEFIRFYNDQWIKIYSTWRSLVREHFILGAPRGTKIHLLEARNEQFRFASVFKDLLDLANVKFPFDKDKDKDTRLDVPFTSVYIPKPSEEASLSFIEFIDILSNAK